MKKEFIDFVKTLIAANPEKAEALMTDKVKAYMEALETSIEEKPEITENGKMVLKYLQDNPAPTYKARDVAEGLFVSSRTVSGTLRKLVNDGFVEKVSNEPVIYAITEKGKNYNID